MVPMLSFDVNFITLSELDLIKIWQDLYLRRVFPSYAFPDFPNMDYSDQVSLNDVALWLSTTPRFLITRLLTDIGRYSANQQKRLRNLLHRERLRSDSNRRIPASSACFQVELAPLGQVQTTIRGEAAFSTKIHRWRHGLFFDRDQEYRFGQTGCHPALELRSQEYQDPRH